MRLFISALALATMLIPVPLIACDLDGIYGNRFSAFSGAHRPVPLPTTDDAGMPVNQTSRVPAPVQAIKSDLEFQSAEEPLAAVQSEAGNPKSPVALEKVAVKAAVLSKR
jgi:hypothetical protein